MQSTSYGSAQFQAGMHSQLASDRPCGRQIVNTDSGHEIHKDQPQLVLDPIREVVDAVRTGKTSLEP